MKYPKLRELREAIRSLASRPATIKHPEQRHTPLPSFRGKPTPDDRECIACGACAEVCPARAIELRDRLDRTPPAREIIWHYDICIYCGQCERLCTTKKGVTLSLEYDLATTDRATLSSQIERELVICEECGETAGSKPHLLWLFRKLGPLASGNFNLLYTAQKELGLADEVTPAHPSRERRRADLFKVACPKCRHQILIFNQTGKKP